MKKFWRKYKKIIIGGAITLVVLPFVDRFITHIFFKENKSKTIENAKGNFSIGQKDGNVTQVYNEKPPPPTPRNLNDDDVKRLENEIPKGYGVNLSYEIDDAETDNYMNQLLAKLKALGFNVQLMSVGKIYAIGDDKSKRFTIAIDNVGKKVDINIIKQVAQ